jgi:hypothetical protein
VSRIYDGLHATLNFQLSTDLAKDAANYPTHLLRAASTDGTTTTTTDFPIVSGTQSSTSVTINWSDICARLPGGGNCEAAATATGHNLTITVYYSKGVISGNGPASGDPTIQIPVNIYAPGATDYNVYGLPTSTGVYQFVPYPGDSKIYVEQVQSTGGSFNYGGTFKKLMVFMSPDSLAKANPKDGLDPAELNFEDDGATLSDSIVDGLENGQLYFFRIAIADEANNIVQFFPPYDLSSTSADDQLHCNTSPSADCPYSATPDEVQGLLSKDFNCFIATAAYGSLFGPQLNTFREFRHRILLTRDWGRWFVKQYYHYGPYGARMIIGHPAIRAVVRGALWPVYGYSLLALRFGLVWANVAALLVASLLIALLAKASIWMFRRKAPTSA